ncbi:MAG: sulfite exporter TauE/SafE family protein [Legionella sp.]|nr:sulfite exporter TauE/SafE family protein [Legionella sp.]
MILTDAFFYALAGVFAGLMSGLMGLGGGLIVVPALLIIFRHNPAIAPQISMQLAAGTSLAIMMFTSQAAIRAHYRLGDVLWTVYRRLAGGIIIGTIMGCVMAAYLPTSWLRWILIIVLLIVAIKMLMDVNTILPVRFPPAWVNALISWIIGFKSGLLGLGGGILIIPYLTYCGVEMRKIAAVSALCTMTVAIIGTITVMITGANEAGLPPYSTGYVYWVAVVFVSIPSALMAPLGARLTYVLPFKYLRYGFILFLLMTIISLL